MSLEQIVESLTNLGLKRVDAEIYAYSAKSCPLIIEDLGLALKYSEDKISASLKTLIAKRLMTQNGKIFYAIPFEKAFELLTTLEKEQKKIG